MTGKDKDPRTVYADIIGLPHHQSETRPHMSLHDRAAQFAPFAALVGFHDMVYEEQRQTDEQTQLTQNEIEELNFKLSQIADMIKNGCCPEVSVTFFEPDNRKSGGSYRTERGIVKKLDAAEKKLIIIGDKGQGAVRSILFMNLTNIDTV